jgi:nucleoside-diphosphate-sugar epimerase
LINFTNKSVNIIYAAERKGDVKNCRANTLKASKELNFSTAISLKEGIFEYLSWYKNL